MMLRVIFLSESIYKMSINVGVVYNCIKHISLSLYSRRRFGERHLNATVRD
jgi:hypothetical protein